MTKHERDFKALSEADQEMDNRVEEAVRRHMAEHDGKMPTQAKLNETIRTSFGRLGPSYRRVREKMESVATRLANMPEVPAELRTASEYALEEMWRMTRAIQNEEIMELRRSQEAKDARHQFDLDDLEGVVSGLEAENERLSDLVAERDAVVAEQQRVIEALQQEVKDLAARQSEREAILALLASSTQEKKPSPKKRSQRPNIGGSQKPELPEG